MPPRGRRCCRRWASGRASRCRAHRALVAELGLSRALRRSLSRGGDSERARPQAHGLRSLGCGGRGADHFAARADRRLAQLGLPLLLAARRLAHGSRAHRSGLHGRGPRLRQLAVARDPPDPARAPGALRRLRQQAARRAHAGSPGGIPGIAAGPDRQPGGRAAAARCVRRGDRRGDPLRAGGRHASTGRPRGCCGAGANTSAGTGTSRTKASGSRAPAGPTTPIRGCCAGWRSTACCSSTRKDHVRWAPAAKFEENREAIRRQVETRAWNPALRSYVAELDGDRRGRDAAAARLVRIRGRRLRADAADLPADSRAARRGRRAPLPLPERSESPEKEGDPVSPGEGAFGICSFWGAEYLALGGGTRGGGSATVRAALRLRQRCRALRRGDRPQHRRGAGQLSPGVHPRGTDQCGALARPAARGRGADAAAGAGPKQEAPKAEEARV